MIDDLLLLSRADIPFEEAQITIHQPMIKEIAMIGEEAFHYGSKFLNFSIDNLELQDKSHLENADDFDIFMSMMNNKEERKFKNNSLLVLTLLFPLHTIKVTSAAIVLTGQDGSKSFINKTNFSVFKKIIEEMFCLKGLGDGKEGFNPAAGRAEKIAAKLMAARERRAKAHGQNLNKIAVFSRYISILAVGLQKDMNELLEYSVYQLYDEFNRFIKKEEYDIFIQYKMAGATGLDDVDNWMDDIHP